MVAARPGTLNHAKTDIELKPGNETRNLTDQRFLPPKWETF
jgi:hypothetical protein